MPGQLDSEVRGELSTLPRSLADVVARHLVVAGELLDEDPERAYEHAAYARRKASRVAAVREAAGVAAYKVGKWQEALSDLRAARRMSGRNAYLAIMADCERGLGRPERALEIARSQEVGKLDIADQIELRIVASGARRDLGDPRAALVELQGPELKERRARPWVARLFYAYADVLLELGREKDAREYFGRASAVDQENVTDADERLAELEGVEIVDIGEDVVWSDAEDPDFGGFDEDEDEERNGSGGTPPGAGEDADRL
ncbi:tetratricopeptide repeat protein [Spinactinospora alkalitolerans]